MRNRRLHIQQSILLLFGLLQRTYALESRWLEGFFANMKWGGSKVREARHHRTAHASACYMPLHLQMQRL